MTNDADRLRDRLIRIVALGAALDVCLRRLMVFYGTSAPQEIEALRDELVGKYKNAEIPAERELDHAKIVGPAIDAIETVFNSALERLKG
jgi:hypothetical protein